MQVQPPTLHVFDNEGALAAAQDETSKIRDVFNEYDGDGNGEISLVEMTNMIVEMDLHHLVSSSPPEQHASGRDGAWADRVEGPPITVAARSPPAQMSVPPAQMMSVPPPRVGRGSPRTRSPPS